MQVEIFGSGNELSHHVAKKLAQRIGEVQDIGFATGRTMEPIYEALRGYAPLKVRAKGWILDEYLGLSISHPQSYRYFLNHLVFKPLGFTSEQIIYPLLDECSVQDAIDKYEKEFQKMDGLDLQLLGLGLNGHVGLNEPGSSVHSRTRVIEIAELTRKSNLIYFNNLSEVPKSAFTFGIANLLQNKELWLVVTGAKKAEIVKRVIEGEVSEDVPASLLKNHSNITMFLDLEAAQLLKPVT